MDFNLPPTRPQFSRPQEAGTLREAIRKADELHGVEEKLYEVEEKLTRIADVKASAEYVRKVEEVERMKEQAAAAAPGGAAFGGRKRRLSGGSESSPKRQVRRGQKRGATD